MRRVLVLVTALIFMVGCGDENPPEQGDVINKEYTPAHWESGYRTEHYTDCGLHFDYTAEDYVFDCRPATRSVHEERHHYVPDRWRLRLRDCTVDDGKRKCREGWLTVDETTYHDYKVGSHFPDPA